MLTNIKSYIIIAALLAAAPSFAQAPDKAVPVQLLVPEVGTVRWVERTTGELIAPRRAELKIKAAGIIGLVHVAEGDRVRKGQPLATLELEDANLALDHATANAKAAETQVEAAKDAVETARVARKQAQIRLETATLDFERAKSLRDKETISQQQYDQMDGQFKLAQNGVEVADKQVRQAQTALEAAKSMLAVAQIGIRSAKQRLTDSTLVAPYDGLVVSKTLMEHEESGGKTLFLVDDSELELTARLPERLLPFISLGTKLDLRTPLATEPVSAKIMTIIPSIDQKTLTFAIKTSIPNPVHTLSHGGYADVSVIVREDREVPIAPARIVKSQEAATGAAPSASRPGYVFTVREGKARKTPVTIGITDSNRVSIISGLASGTPIVDRGFEQLDDGTPVTVVSEVAR